MYLFILFILSLLIYIELLVQPPLVPNNDFIKTNLELPFPRKFRKWSSSVNSTNLIYYQETLCLNKYKKNKDILFRKLGAMHSYWMNYSKTKTLYFIAFSHKNNIIVQNHKTFCLYHWLFFTVFSSPFSSRH